jgi:hypothetical protein
MISLVIGGITGCFAFVIENLEFLKIAQKEDLGTLTFRYVMREIRQGNHWMARANVLLGFIFT